MDSSEAMARFWAISLIAMTVVLIIFAVVGLRSHLVKRREKMRLYSDPLPDKSRMVVLDAIQTLDGLRTGSYMNREDNKTGTHFAAIIQDVRRYYKALNGRPDTTAFFVELEQFVKGPCADYKLLVADRRYVDEKRLARSKKEIEAFADKTYRLAERLVAGELASTHGRIEMREEAENLEREFEQLTPKALPAKGKLLGVIPFKRR